jgi:hypothetical protein
MKSRLSAYALIALAASPAFAATNSSVRNADSAPEPMKARSTILTVEILGGTNSLGIDASATSGSTSVQTSGTMSGASALQGFALGSTFKMTEGFGLGVDIALINKKFDKFSMGGQSSNTAGSSKILTERATVLARFYPANGFSVGIGPYASYFSSASATDENGKSESNSLNDSGLNRWDYGMTVGARGEIPLSSRVELTIDARYYYGIANLFDQSKIQSGNSSTNVTASAKTGDFQMGVGAGFLF